MRKWKNSASAGIRRIRNGITHSDLDLRLSLTLIRTYYCSGYPKYVVADPASGEGREIDFVTGSINLIESSVPKATSGERQALSDVLACIFGNFIAPSTVCGNAAGIISAVRNAISLTCPQSLIANLVSAIGTSIFCGGVECVIQAVTGPPPAGPPAAGLALVNNVGVGDTVLTGGKKNYTFAIPSGASNLTVTLAGTGGDADLYVKFGSEPTVGNQVNNSTNCVPYTGGSNEVCTISNPAAGTWYIVVHGYSTALYALKANYTVASLPPAGPSSSSQNFPGMVNNGQTSAFVTVNVASGQSLVRFMLSWSGGGDLDLHVYSPSSNHYGYGAIIPQGYNYTANPEIITITNPAPGPYRFQVNGYSAPGGRSYQVVVQTQ